ncbi:hypothetical protein [Comamonas composti]|uniref:hypothetical protein n=1 Tax=Comamonas composti TaxID=408558 RepID=UPI0012EC1D0C|nr:hypothetical protein [Comamonas composti]
MVLIFADYLGHSQGYARLVPRRKSFKKPNGDNKHHKGINEIYSSIIYFGKIKIIHAPAGIA